MTAVSGGTDLQLNSYSSLLSQVVTDQDALSAFYNTDTFSVGEAPLITGVQLVTNP